MSRQLLIFSAFLCLALLLPGHPAQAADGLLDALVGAGRDRPQVLYEGKQKTYRPGVMDSEHLKNCLILAHRMDQSTAEIDQRKAAIRRLDDQIREAGPALQRDIPQTGQSRAKAEAFAARVQTYNGWVEERLAVVRQHNNLVRNFTEMSGRFDTECNGQSYFPSDLTAVIPQLPPEIRARLR